MLDHRLQVLIDDDRLRRLEREAKRRRVSVAEVVREAIDTKLGPSEAERRAAWERLRSDPMLPPVDIDELKALIDEGRSGVA